MARAYRISYRICIVLAFVAKAMLLAIPVLIVFDVSVRTAGLRPPLWTIPVNEILLVYITLLGTPYLIRVKGHVFISILVSRLRGRTRQGLERAIYFVSTLLFAYLFIVATQELVRVFLAGETQIRAFPVPTWLVYLPMSVGFLLSAVEFSRYLVQDSYFETDVTGQDGL